MQELTQRQSEILRLVVEEYVTTGQPVASKALVERSGLDVSPSTVRGELAELERQGLLTHPHTSAGRVPTEHGYRFFADRLLERLEPRPPSFPLQLADERSELETALQSTTDMLSELTRLLALVSAPAVETATIRHVEVLLLQPHDRHDGGHHVGRIGHEAAVPVRARRRLWARRLGGGVSQRADRRPEARLADLSVAASKTRRSRRWSGCSSTFCGRCSSARRPRSSASSSGGAASLLDTASADELRAYRGLLELLERRKTLLDVVAAALDSRRPFVRVGDELGNPALQELSLVGSTYGLTTRTLGTVSLLGPLRMDYERAIRSVRSAASELSRLSESVYDED